MCVKNLSSDIVNGTMGIVKDVFPRERCVLVTTTAGKDEYFYLTDFFVDIDALTKVTRRQLPLRLCYVATVHKLQGQEFERVDIDLDGLGHFRGGLYTGENPRWCKADLCRMAQSNAYFQGFSKKDQNRLQETKSETPRQARQLDYDQQATAQTVGFL